MLALPDGLAAFAAYAQFIAYKVTPSTSRPGKLDKLPCDWRTGKVVSAHDPQYWADFETVRASGHPIGFVFTEGDPFFAVDLDDAALPDGSGWKPHVLPICELLKGAAIERSISGTGLHIFGVGKPPAHRCESAFKIGGLYFSDRFIALTGDGFSGNAATNCSAALPLLVSTYWAPDASAGSPQAWTTEPDPEWYGPVDDTDLIRRAMQSRSSASAFGTRASFADLWLADEQALGCAYPAEGRPYDASAADGALAQHLAFWTGKNCERIRSLMERSKLQRDKWEREDYLPRTILGAVARQVDVLQDKRPISAPPGEAVATTTNESRLLNGEGQLELFKGCVYVEEGHRVLIPGGRLLKPDQFRAHFGGYSFQMDQINEKMSRDPYEAFINSQLFKSPRAVGTCFRPQLTPGAIIELEGRRMVNTYCPVDIPRKSGDATPFLNHLAKVLPDQQDRDILLSYMAACVQHQGVKFQWAPLLQGVEGNGKTLFTRCVAEAVGRRYSHLPPAHEISEKFNSWLFDTVFVGVEDIYVPNQKQEIFEILKPMITSDFLAKRAMQTDQVMKEVVANFIFNSNHKDGLIKTRNDRRVCILFCAQQQFEDLARDGMTGDYFPKLYAWLKADGYSIVNELLHTYQIPAALDPAGELQRAPNTTTTHEAIGASLGAVEQEIEESIAQGLPGFSGGWISSIWLERMLDRMGLARRVSHNRRKEMLLQMGYRWHPALKDGRVNNPVMPDGGKPRLYIHDSALAKLVTAPAESCQTL